MGFRRNLNYLPRAIFIKSIGLTTFLYLLRKNQATAPTTIIINNQPINFPEPLFDFILQVPKQQTPSLA